MIDPQPLSRDIEHHEVRSARLRVHQDQALLTSVFTGQADAMPTYYMGSEVMLRGPFSLSSPRLPGTALQEEDILARLMQVREDMERSKIVLEQRKQSIARGHAR